MFDNGTGGRFGSWTMMVFTMTWYTIYMPQFGREGHLHVELLIPSHHPNLLVLWVRFYPARQICNNYQVFASIKNMLGTAFFRYAQSIGSLRIGKLIQAGIVQEVQNT
jgi:hypothetical protein